MSGGILRFMMLGLIFPLLWSLSVHGQSNREEGCPAYSTANPQSVAVAVDSVEFEADAGLTPEIRARLVDDFKHGNFHASSSIDMDWQHGLANQARLLLQEQGYFRALVDVSAGLIRAEARRLHYWVSVKAESGPQYRLRRVKFENAMEFSESKLRMQLHLEEGDLFNVPKVREALGNLGRLYGRLGYIDFTTEVQTDLDEDVHRIDLTLKLDVATQYRVRSVTIHGFGSAVEKALTSKFEAGQIFDGTAINDFFKANSAALPKGTSLENGLAIVRDVQNGAVDLVFEPHGCDTH